jgi:hypothetical protein
MEDFQITGFNFVDRDSRGLPGFLTVTYSMKISGEIEGTAHNIEGKVRIAPDWPDTPAALEQAAKAEIKRVLAKAASSI